MQCAKGWLKGKGSASSDATPVLPTKPALSLIIRSTSSPTACANKHNSSNYPREFHASGRISTTPSAMNTRNTGPRKRSNHHRRSPRTINNGQSKRTKPRSKPVHTRRGAREKPPTRRTDYSGSDEGAVTDARPLPPSSEQQPQPQPQHQHQQQQQQAWQPRTLRLCSSGELTDEVESEGAGDGGRGWDVLPDGAEEGEEGWVPVMVAGEDEGEGWMSLTGSLVMMRVVRQAAKGEVDSRSSHLGRHKR